MLTHLGNLNSKMSSVQVKLAPNLLLDAHQLVPVDGVPFVVFVENHSKTIDCSSWKVQSMVDTEPSIMPRWTSLLLPGVL